MTNVKNAALWNAASIECFGFLWSANRRQLSRQEFDHHVDVDRQANVGRAR